ncbi:MAG: DNA mismatch repair endonuclease MutL [Clostridia bacterium]|nr:DNA mismatch repair endonuclease MutL [Clostridia bacterium]
MANINILDKTIFNRIAAGEVVEKPASVVKELVENCIDAGATLITIEITGGGIKRIRVTDNGCGMDYENIPKAFLPHATSKISCLEDLDKIGTLGFRGEALSSIASVAKITATSKVKQNESGSKLVIEGGEIQEHTEIGCVDGTSITVEDLFYNVPARAKFLRKPKTEESEITNLVSRLILANPTISIKYVVDGKIIFHSPATDLKDAIYTIYGASAVESIVPIKYTYQNLINIEGYIGLPSYTKPNRTYQTIIINGRYVNNKTISTAILNAYEPYIMKSCFPFFVCHVTLPLDKVDVNVHPNKLEVKFENNNLIFGAFYTPISDILHNLSTQVRKYETEEIIEQKEQQIDLSNLKIVKENTGKQFDSTIVEESPKDVVQYATLEEDEEEPLKEVKFDEERNKLMNSLSNFVSTQNTDLSVENNQFASEMISIATKEHIFSQMDLFEEKKVDLNTVKIIGTCFNTYIIVENQDSIYFIDQHAGHERLLYDKFKQSFENNDMAIQSLLVPYILSTNYLESDFVNNNLAIFKDLGFDIEPFGINSFKVSSVPVLLKDISLHQFFNDVLKDISKNINLTKSDILKDYLERSACRSAVKANDILSKSEIEILLNMLNQNNQVLLCPHGRPVIIEVPSKEIEKWFKRIV